MRPAPSTLARLISLTLAVMLAFAGLLVGTTTASADESGPMTGAPAVGDCFDATFKQAEGASLNVAPVACSDDHTLVTTKVVQLPAGISLDDYEAVNKVANCAAATEKKVGKNPLLRALTLYSTFAFIPTDAQQADGARWASCHVAVWDQKGLNDLPTRLPKAKKKNADAVAKCLSKGRQTVVCTTKHQYRAQLATYVAARGSDTAVANTVKKASVVCSRRTGKGSLYSYYRLTAAKVVLTCYAKTTK